MIGTIVNTAAVITGSAIGVLIRKHLPKNVIKIVFQTLGIFTLFLGVKMSLQINQMLLAVVSLVLGSITGELLKLEQTMEKLGGKIKKRFGSDEETFTEGMLTGFLMFCMGSLTILGTLQEGMNHDPSLLLTKSVMDGFSSLMLAAGFGIGVMFSAVPLFLYQAGLTLFFMFLKSKIPSAVVVQLTGVGGIILIGLGINILEIKKIPIMNMLPALIYAPVLSVIFH